MLSHNKFNSSSQIQECYSTNLLTCSYNTVWKLVFKVFHRNKIITTIISRLDSKALPIISPVSLQSACKSFDEWSAGLLIVTCNECYGHYDRGKSMKEISFFPPLTGLTFLERTNNIWDSFEHQKSAKAGCFCSAQGGSVLNPNGATYESFLTVAFCARGVNP